MAGSRQEAKGSPEVVGITAVPAGAGRAVARHFTQDGAFLGLFVRGQDVNGVKVDVERPGESPPLRR